MSQSTSTSASGPVTFNSVSDGSNVLVWAIVGAVVLAAIWLFKRK